MDVIETEHGVYPDDVVPGNFPTLGVIVPSAPLRERRTHASLHTPRHPPLHTPPGICKFRSNTAVSVDEGPHIDEAQIDELLQQHALTNSQVEQHAADIHSHRHTLARTPTTPPRQVHSVFDDVDLNGDGWLTEDELQSALEDLGFKEMNGWTGGYGWRLRVAVTALVSVTL